MAPEASCCWKVIRCWLFIPSPRAAVGRDGEFHVSEMSRGGGELTESPHPRPLPTTLCTRGREGNSATSMAGIHYAQILFPIVPLCE
jgi:hypothetical protein